MFLNFPSTVIKEVNLKSTNAKEGLGVKLNNLQKNEKNVSFSLNLKKYDNKNNCIGDVTSYLDDHMCQLKTNTLFDKVYYIRKLKIDRWAKTTKREDCNHFELHVTLETTCDHVYFVSSGPFQVLSHQTQLPEKLKRTRSSKSFGLDLLADATLVKKVHTKDELIDQANEIRQKIQVLEEKEKSLREEASKY